MKCFRKNFKNTNFIGVVIPTISKHLRYIFNEDELSEEMVVFKMENTTQHGVIEWFLPSTRKSKT